MKDLAVKEAVNPDMWVALVLSAVPWLQPFDKELIEKLKEEMKDGM